MVNSGYRKGYVFAAACVGMLLFGIVMISLGSILPEVIQKFRLNEVETGSLLTLLPFGILAGSLVFGPMIDWFSYKKILLAGSIFTLLGIEGIIFSEISIMLYLSVFCIGLGGGILNGSTNALVSEISEEGHGANLSLLGVFFGIGALGTPVILGVLKDVYSFETIFFLLGICIVLIIIFLASIRYPKSAETKGLPIKGAMRMAKDPLLLLFGFILFFQSGIEGLTNNWANIYLNEFKGIDASGSLFILSSFVGALTIARILLGKILRMFNSLKVLVGGFIIAFIGCICLAMGDGYYLHMVGMCAIGVGLAGGFPVILGYIGKTYRRFSGTAFSIVMTIALIGNVIANYAMGLMSQKYGLGILPYLIVTAILVILGLLYITKHKHGTVIN